MTWRVLEGDCRAVLATLPAESAQCCVTSPPYWGLRDYGVAGQLGLEATPGEYVATMVEVFREVRRVLRPDGALWLNLGDSYAGQAGGAPGSNAQVTNTRAGRQSRPGARREGDGLKPKDLVGIPWRVAFALQADGWWLRSDVVWSKPNPMPESVTDRPTKAHEYVFLLTKSSSYFYDADAIREDFAPTSLADSRIGTERTRDYSAAADAFGAGTSASRRCAGNALGNPDAGRNCRSVWTISTKPFAGAHFAVMPWDLAERCILAGSSAGSTVLDPFCGAGTVGMVARRHGRSFVGIELNPAYAEMARERISGDMPLFNTPTEAA